MNSIVEVTQKSISTDKAWLAQKKGDFNLLQKPESLDFVEDKIQIEINLHDFRQLIENNRISAAEMRCLNKDSKDKVQKVLLQSIYL